MNKLNNEQAINATKQWLEQIVIGLNFCPFAKKEFVNNTIHYEVCSEKTYTATLEAFIKQVEQLVKNPEIETTLFMLNAGFNKFDEFLALIDYANDLLVDCGYEGVFQLATFHPDYLFDGEAIEAASHFTNRSPLPMLHILREASMAKVLASYKEPESIPQANIALAEAKGSEYFQSLCKRFISTQVLDEH